MTENAYENTRRIVYAGGATFVPVCERCGRFVKADPVIVEIGDRLSDMPNADCSKCGRTHMLFEGFYEGFDYVSVGANLHQREN